MIRSRVGLAIEEAAFARIVSARGQTKAWLLSWKSARLRFWVGSTRRYPNFRAGKQGHLAVRGKQTSEQPEISLNNRK